MSSSTKITDYFAAQKRSGRRPGNNKKAAVSSEQDRAESQVSLSPPKRLLRSGRKMATITSGAADAAISRVTPSRVASSRTGGRTPKKQPEATVIAQLDFDEPMAAPEVVAQPQPEVVSKPQPEVVSKPQPEVVSKPQPEVVSKPQPEVISKPQPEVVSKPQPEVVSKPQPEVVSKPQPEVVSKPQPEVVSKPQPEVVSKPQPEVVSKPQSDVVSKPQPEVVFKPQPEVISKPQPEVVSKPQLEAVAKLDAVTKHPKIVDEPAVAAESKLADKVNLTLKARPVATAAAVKPIESKVVAEPELIAEETEPEAAVEPVEAAKLLASRAQELPLPPDLDTLRLQFDALEQMLVLVLGKQLPTFERLKDCVERMTRRAFDIDKLGQIRTLYPDCYALRWVPKSALPTAPSSRHTSNGGGATSGHLLLVEPRLPNAADSKMSPRQQLERRSEFALRLYRYVAERHRRFLIDRGASSDRLPSLLSLRRWHPEFPLYRLPMPAAAPTPPAPEMTADAAKVTTARQALDQLRPALPERLQRALEAAVASEVASSTAASSATTTPTKKATAPPSGIDADLLARIRRRDAEQSARRLLTRREPAVEAELKLLEKAPTAARALKLQCLADKRRAMPLAEAAERLSRSQPGRLPESEADALLRLLCRLCPAWASLVELPSRPGQFLRVQAAVGNFDDVLAAIDARRAELEAS